MDLRLIKSKERMNSTVCRCSHWPSLPPTTKIPAATQHHLLCAFKDKTKMISSSSCSRSWKIFSLQHSDTEEGRKPGLPVNGVSWNDKQWLCRKVLKHLYHSKWYIHSQMETFLPVQWQSHPILSILSPQKHWIHSFAPSCQSEEGKLLWWMSWLVAPWSDKTQDITNSTRIIFTNHWKLPCSWALLWNDL